MFSVAREGHRVMCFQWLERVGNVFTVARKGMVMFSVAREGRVMCFQWLKGG